MKDDELAEWLKEAAQRKRDPQPPSGFDEGSPATEHDLIPNIRPLVGLAGLTIAYLQYYFLDVMLQIQSLPTLALIPSFLAKSS